MCCNALLLLKINVTLRDKYFARITNALTMSQQAPQILKAPLGKVNSLVGDLAFIIIELFLLTYLFMSIWNSVLYERIEGVDKITFWDSMAILLIPMCFVFRPLGYL